MRTVSVEVRPSFESHIRYVVREAEASQFEVMYEGPPWRTSASPDDVATPWMAAGDRRARVVVSSPALSALFKELASLKVPAAPRPGTMGLDGTTFELTIEDWPISVTYEWWQNAPGSWKPLEEIMEKLISIANDVLDGE